ncbi:MAG: alanine racemase [Rhodospirillales bacterium]|nr:alanine racemase [Rhodospirillales bacterium]|tara:strand:- start:2847 stop:3959 length:1113 start_codon:yes stop_codon:yes gene_type:complete
MNFKDQTGSILTIDLNILAKNFAYLRERLSQNTICSAVVKSNAYGLGLEQVVCRLLKEGCNSFFVAMMDEAIKVRNLLIKSRVNADIYLLNGLNKGIEKDIIKFGVIPVLNCIAEIEQWSSYCKAKEKNFKAIINFDTGMSRLGLDAYETTELQRNPKLIENIDIDYLMSHLACADDREQLKNKEQKHLFDKIRSKFISTKASLSNSAGIFLGKGYHYDLVRPGAAIYGLQPIKKEVNEIEQVINLKAKILQTFIVDRGTTVGYGATFRTNRKTRIATVALGYGDGYFRTLGNHGKGYIGRQPVPVIGRISMDLVTFDVTDVKEEDSGRGDMIELIGPHYTVDQLASDAGTIGYEILTSLGGRYFRDYVG